MPKKTTTKSKASDVEDVLKLDVTKHILVPQHDVCSEEEKKSVLAHYQVQPNQLPRITANDPAIRHLGCKIGDLIKISRVSETAGTAVFYRIVSSE